MLVISKSDLLTYFDFDIENIKKDALSLNPHIKIIVTSAKTGEGLDEWFELLKKEVEEKDSRIRGFE